MQQREKLLFVCTVFFMLFLCSSCSSFDRYVENSISAQAEAELHDSAEYKQYEQYISEGKFNEEDYNLIVQPVNPSSDEEPEERISITFAQNSFLDCRYRRNEENTYPLETRICFLEPGDSLYVSDVTTRNPAGDLYGCSEFRVWAYDADGNRGDQPYCITKYNAEQKPCIILTIPQDYSGNGFSIEPLGAYKNRTITVRAYYINNEGKQQELGGKWMVGNETIRKSKDLSPIESYTLKYDYSNYEKNDYYFVSSEPPCFYAKEADQTVVFPEISSNENVTEYSVLMHRYLKLKVNNEAITLLKRALGFADELLDNVNIINFDGIVDTIENHFNFQSRNIITSISINDERKDDFLNANKRKDSFEISQLRCEDIVSITVGKEYMITGKNINIEPGSLLDDGYEYRITIPDTNKNIEINISKRNSNPDGKFEEISLDHATLTLYRADGSIIRTGDELPADDDLVTMEIKADDDYYLDGKDVKDFTIFNKKMKYSDFQKKAEDILKKHPAVPYIIINITEDDCGTGKYKLDGEDIKGSIIKARIGQKIELTFTVTSPYKLSGIRKKDTVSKKITVSADMDTTINYKTFGIKIIKKED